MDTMWRSGATALPGLDRWRATGDVLVDPPLSKTGPQAPDRAGAGAGPCKPGTPLSGTAVHRTTFFVLDVQARESSTCGWRRRAGG